MRLVHVCGNVEHLSIAVLFNLLLNVGHDAGCKPCPSATCGVPYRILQSDAQWLCHMQLEKNMYELVLRKAFYRSANASLK